MAITFDEAVEFDDGIRLIRVGKEGVTAAIPTNDTKFVTRFAGLINWLEAAAEEIGKRELPVQDEENAIDTNALLKFAEAREEMCKEACEKLDSLFGHGVCSAAFGAEVPDEACVFEFMEKMVPFVNRAFSERGEKIALKYNRNRKGGRTQRSKAELIEDYKAAE